MCRHFIVYKMAVYLLALACLLGVASGLTCSDVTSEYIRAGESVVSRHTETDILCQMGQSGTFTLSTGRPDIRVDCPYEWGRTSQGQYTMTVACQNVPVETTGDAFNYVKTRALCQAKYDVMSIINSNIIRNAEGRANGYPANDYEPYVTVHCGPES